MIKMTDQIADEANFPRVLGLKSEIRNRSLELVFNTASKRIDTHQLICEYSEREKTLPLIQSYTWLGKSSRERR